MVEVVGAEPGKDVVAGHGHCLVLSGCPCLVHQSLEEPDNQRFNAGDQPLVDPVTLLWQVKLHDDGRAISPYS